VFDQQKRRASRDRPGPGQPVPDLREQIFELAARVISRSSRERPADAVLRAELKAARAFPREASAEVSHCVFTYFRWFGWINKTQPIELQIREALRLNGRFQREPNTFDDAQLLEKTLPAWVAGEMNLTAELVRAFQTKPRLWLRAHSNHGQALAETLGYCRYFSPELPDALEYSGEEDLFRTREFQAGEFEVQDISSQAVGLICAPQKGETWWDTCAGEGGKLLHLSDLMENGGLIWASDRAEWRLKILKRRAARAKAFNYRAVIWDGGARLPTRTKFDGVLIDAPCSGVGTWGRNPHARWTTTPEDVKELAAIQSELLRHAAVAVKPGGKLIYSVCSLFRLETERVATGFENELPEFTALPISNPLAPRHAAEDRLWIQPQDFGGNGMFIAAWRRQK
jgi:16S rRNA (cytosine967-C5)-methyltransferase